MYSQQLSEAVSVCSQEHSMLSESRNTSHNYIQKANVRVPTTQVRDQETVLNLFLNPVRVSPRPKFTIGVQHSCRLCTARSYGNLMVLSNLLAFGYRSLGAKHSIHNNASTSLSLQEALASENLQKYKQVHLAFEAANERAEQAETLLQRNKSGRFGGIIASVSHTTPQLLTRLFSQRSASNLSRGRLRATGGADI